MDIEKYKENDMEIEVTDQLSKVKKFWNNRPCNIFHSNKLIGTKEYFDEVEYKKHKAEPHILSFADFDSWKNKNVLEIGCGIGTATVCFARSGANVTAVDISETSVNLCKSRLGTYGLFASVYEANAENLTDYLPVPISLSNRFDLIYSFGVIHHTPNPKKIIQQMHKFIKASGEIRIMLYSLVSFKAFQVMRENGLSDMSKMRAVIREHSEAQYGSPCTFVYSFDEIRDLLSPYFTVQKMWKDHIFTWDIDEYKKGNFVKADAWKNVDDKELKQLEKELGWHTLVVATPNF